MFPHIGKLSCLKSLSVYIVNPEKGHKLRRKTGNQSLQNVSSLSEVEEANFIGKKDLNELCLSWRHQGSSVKTPIISDDRVFEVLQPHRNLKGLKIYYYQGLCFPSWIRTLSNLLTLIVKDCMLCERFSSLGKLPSLKKLELFNVSVKYLDDDEFENGVEMINFPSLEILTLNNLSNLEGLLKVERGEMSLSFYFEHPKL
ncbi:putative leucine-rich repeat domain, L domain-containing protein [Medicago truncatula]|uniref:Putative leucine-rich repeat domain, L domain-containing protein n=1 Tax=Medicago truncatula TaxID=3880 RepID=A0A396HSD0_MEDTR|nr:putative leucine-rich repeat domain, L domain-containing protein [Medicago truncatula]